MNKSLIDLYNILLDRKLYKYSKIINKEIIKLAEPAEPFLHWFKGEERVYIPYDSDPELNEKMLRERHPIILECINFMGFNSDEASLYKKLLKIGERSKKRFLIGEFFFKDVLVKKLNTISELDSLEDKKAEFIDRAKNIFLKKDSFIKIPSFVDEYSENINANESIKIQNLILNLSNSFKKYSSDDLREGSYSNVEKTVVISRNRHDITHMSTGRNWTSCMNLHGGEYNDEPFCEAESGGFIAYLIDSYDVDIENPYSRVLVRRFDSNDGGKSIALVEDAIYGIEDQGFLNIVKNWVDKKQGRIELGDYRLSGMEWSDVYSSEGLYGIPEGLNVDEVIRNPNILFKYSEKIYMLKDNAAYQVVMETMPDLISTLNIFSKYKMFSSQEEMDSFVKISEDNSKKSKDAVLRIMAIYRAEDDYDYSSEHAEEFIDNLEYDEEELESYNEKKEDDSGNIITVNKFDSKNPYYSFEKQIIKMIIGESSRYEKIILNKQEYFDNISKYKPVVMQALVNMAKKESRRNPNSLSSQSLIAIRRMSESGLMKGHHLMLSSHNPNSANQDLLFKFVKEKTLELEKAVKDCTYSVKELGGLAISSDLNILNRGGDFGYIASILQNSDNENIKNHINEKVEESFNTIIKSDIPKDRSKKINLLSSILRKLTYRKSRYNENGSQISGTDESIGLTLTNNICESILLLVDEHEKYDNYNKNEIQSLIRSLAFIKCDSKIIYSKIMDSILGIIIEYDAPPNNEGNSKNATSIRLNKLITNKPMIQINSNNFLKFLNNNKIYINLDKKIDFILSNCKAQINKEIEYYKEDISEATEEEEIRYLKMDTREKLKKIGDFSKKLIEIIR